MNLQAATAVFSLFRRLRLYGVVIIVFILTCCTYSPAAAQTKNGAKQDKLYAKAVKAYQLQNLPQALQQLDALLGKSPGYIKGWLLKADIEYDQKNYEKAITSYRQAIGIDSAYFPKAYYLLANLYFEKEQYELSNRYYDKYLKFNPRSQPELTKIAVNKALCSYRLQLMSNARPFEPVNLGPNINTSGSEYVNSLSLDQKRLLFTRKAAGGRSDESFYYSERQPAAGSSEHWQPAAELGEPINTPGNEGALCFSADGQLIILTACSRPDSYGSCDLYVSQKKGSGWSMPVNLGPEINSTAWDSQPCLSADGRTLYFVSARAGGLGGSDIYRSTLDDSGYWSAPQNLGDSINTPADEMAPFIHPDGKSLYFSSRGHRGMGGADLFIARLGVNGRWQKPVNLGYPVNTNRDEINLIINASGDEAYISSEKDGGYGQMDIYSFRLDKAIQPEAVSYVRGKVYDAQTLAPLQASLELIELRSAAVQSGSRSDATDGSFIMSLPVANTYALNVSCPGYLFFSMQFNTAEGYDAANPLTVDVPLQRIAVGEKVILRNIFFDTDKYELLPESKAELGKLIAFMQKNPQLRIEIGGHTDSEGSDAYNLALSQNRADAVYIYLVAGGVEAYRLSAKGYGESAPVDTNDTPQGRANNRRTEFRVTGR